MRLLKQKWHNTTAGRASKEKESSGAAGYLSCRRPTKSSTSRSFEMMTATSPRLFMSSYLRGCLNSNSNSDSPTQTSSSSAANDDLVAVELTTADHSQAQRAPLGNLFMQAIRACRSRPLARRRKRSPQLGDDDDDDCDKWTHHAQPDMVVVSGTDVVSPPVVVSGTGAETTTTTNGFSYYSSTFTNSIRSKFNQFKYNALCVYKGACNTFFLLLTCL